MKTYLISYATDDFKDRQELVHSNEHMVDFIHIKYGPDDISQSFLDENSYILHQKTGAGYWLWKPYFILKTLDIIKENDIVVYIDCGDRVINPIRPYIIEKLKTLNSLIHLGYHSHSEFCKDKCFELMNCDNNLYRSSRQVEAGFLAFKKTDDSYSFVNKWLNFCKNPDIITDDNITEEERGRLRAHRHDQAILTNLSIMDKTPLICMSELRNYINFNEYC